jgi:hypothetical protein
VKEQAMEPAIDDLLNKIKAIARGPNADLLRKLVDVLYEWEIEKQSWNISCTKEGFENIKTDERFIGLLTLARVVNSLRFCQKAVLNAKGSSSPSSARTRINSFLFASSVLYEGFLLVEKLGKHYKDIDSFKDGFGYLLRDKSVRELRDLILKRGRNKFVFHYDINIVKESLKRFELPNIIFASGYGTSTGEMYFSLVDEIAINYLLQPAENESNDSLNERFGNILKDPTNIIGEFAKSADLLMSDVLKDLGFIVKR